MEFLSLLSPELFLFVVAGVIVGIVFGAIPGMTATMAVAVCLPLTYSLDMVNGLGLLLGLYVGGISGGLVPAILLNIPGTPSSITTTFDGYPMTQKGEGEKALKTGITSSLFGGLLSVCILFFLLPYWQILRSNFPISRNFSLSFLLCPLLHLFPKEACWWAFSAVSWVSGSV